MATSTSKNNSSNGLIIEEWLSKLTLEQKIDIIVGVGMNIEGLMEASRPDKVKGQAGSTHDIPELGIPAIILADGPAGLRIEPKREGTDKTFYCTAFPVATVLASTWDTNLIEKVGQAIGAEVKEYGVDIHLAPGMNIHRNPLTGRNFEYYSEDPYLSGHIATAIVKGVESQGVGSSIKHFVANNSETNRSMVDTIVSERALREIYLRGFEIAVKEAKPMTVMSAYNKINGVYASESSELLEVILREEWGFDGIVMTDWFAGKDPVAQMVAGNDLLMPGTPEEKKTLIEAVENGKLDVAIVDRNVERILKVIVQTPVFHKYPYTDEPDLKSHAQLSRKTATEGTILLKNEDQTLPLPKVEQKIAVFGVGSYDFKAGGTGSGDVNKAYTISLFEGLENAGIPIDQELKTAYEAYLKEEKPKQPKTRHPLEPKPPIPEMPLTEATINEKAAESDMAFLTIGRTSGEFKDRQVDNDFDLNDTEQDLIEKVTKAFHAVGKKVVVILNIGNVIEMVSWQDQVDAIVLAWQGGQEAGNALTDVLSGKVNPSGKLPTTFTRSYTDVPSSDSFPGRDIPGGIVETLDGVIESRESEIFFEDDIFVGYRYYLTKDIPVAYPFGFGLSYTTFEYSDLELSTSHFETELKASIKISNTGVVAGREVVQLYLQAPGKTLSKPIHELKDFAKTRLLKAGESEVLHFKLNAKDLASFDSEKSAWMIEAGNYMIKIGASSTAIKLTQTFTAPDIEVEKVNKVLLPEKEIN